MTYRYSAPERLEEDYRSGFRTPYEDIAEELAPDIENLVGMIGAGAPLVPVEGRVSDYKSFLASATAARLVDNGVSVVMFAPQTANRETLVERVRGFGSDLIEHPGRIDLCIWDQWRENIGKVDQSTCEQNGCVYYLDSAEDIADRSEDAASVHTMRAGGIDLDAETLRGLGEEQGFCPAQLYRHTRSMAWTDDAVGLATYAKAFKDAAVSGDNPLTCDVALLDEAHTVAANMDMVVHSVDPDALSGAFSVLDEALNGVSERWARRARTEVEGLRSAVEHWLDRSEEEHVSPESVFAGATVSLSDGFDVLETISSRAMQSMRRHTRRGDWDRAAEAEKPHAAAGAVREFLSRIKSYRDGDADFVHSRYQENGERINEIAFRSVVDPGSGGTTPLEVYRAWEERGTHPAIADRWGPLLDRYIESLWDGRSMQYAGDQPGAPMTPMNRLREIAGADTLITLSATHNGLSDPTRDPDRPRPTRHRLLCAPVNLRARGSGREDYDGKTAVTPETPWFRTMFAEAVRESGDTVAAVPINYSNASSWADMPVIRLGDGSGYGLVPNSKGAIGEKELESMAIDTVACGVQVQSPAPTARMLVQWWEMLAPRREDPVSVLETSWRLLAQHAVSGTIQAGGRFDWDAVNLVFERPGLVELAGFECETATAASPGFAGAFCRAYEEVHGSWSDRRCGARAARVVRYLDRTDGRTPSPTQTVNEFARIYGTDEDSARDAVRLAIEDGPVGVRETERGTRLTTK